jgi:predicted alpha/beta hydrolase
MISPYIHTGHIIPLLSDNLRSKVSRAVLVAVTNPNWQIAPSQLTEKMRSHWTNAVELTAKKGYFPPEASFFKITLPFGVGTEWSSKIGGEDIRYFAGDPSLSPFYSSWNPDKEVISVAFQDDNTLFSTPKAIDEWCKLLPRAKMTRLMVDPEEFGWDTVGHIGMFKEGQEGVWELIRDIIVDGRLPTKGEIRRWNQGGAKL